VRSSRRARSVRESPPGRALCSGARPRARNASVSRFGPPSTPVTAPTPPGQPRTSPKTPLPHRSLFTNEADSEAAGAGRRDPLTFPSFPFRRARPPQRQSLPARDERVPNRSGATAALRRTRTRVAAARHFAPACSSSRRGRGSLHGGGAAAQFSLVDAFAKRYIHVQLALLSASVHLERDAG